MSYYAKSGGYKLLAGVDLDILVWFGGGGGGGDQLPYVLIVAINSE